MQASFPVFVGRALSWLTQEESVLIREVGLVEVPVPDAAVSDADGNPISTSRTASGIVFQANRPGAYSIISAKGQMRVIANILDPAYAQINHSRFADLPSGGQRVLSRRYEWLAEPWLTLLVFGAVLIIVEWVTFARRITI